MTGPHCGEWGAGVEACESERSRGSADGTNDNEM